MVRLPLQQGQPGAMRSTWVAVFSKTLFPLASPSAITALASLVSSLDAMSASRIVPVAPYTSDTIVRAAI